ncbi:hypothetical protein [Rhodococcus sp. KRD162]|jgi:hypothetical protein|uniref:hypothetical protein n=1 Tax=Rhodococcus sp. KRD162 TaxID=2729725 RepID=UPI0019D06306|nr:hypothetical protein [Rhodococcus sp. KRD162]
MGEANRYCHLIVKVDQFEGLHYVASIPPVTELPPTCSCGFTRVEYSGEWTELRRHIEDRGEFGSLDPTPRDQ